MGGWIVDMLGNPFEALVAQIVEAMGQSLGFLNDVTRPDLGAVWLDEAWRRTVYLAGFFATVLTMIAAAKALVLKGMHGVAAVLGRVAMILVGMTLAVPLVDVLLDLDDAVSGVFSADLAADTASILTGMTDYAATAQDAAMMWAFAAFWAFLAAVALTIQLFVRSILIYMVVVAVPLILAANVIDVGSDLLKRAAKFVAVAVFAKSAVALTVMLGTLPIAAGGASAAVAMTALGTIMVLPFAPWLLFKALGGVAQGAARVSQRVAPTGLYSKAGAALGGPSGVVAAAQRRNDGVKAHMKAVVGSGASAMGSAAAADAARKRAAAQQTRVEEDPRGSVGVDAATGQPETQRALPAGRRIVGPEWVADPAVAADHAATANGPPVPIRDWRQAEPGDQVRPDTGVSGATVYYRRGTVAAATSTPKPAGWVPPIRDPSTGGVVAAADPTMSAGDYRMSAAAHDRYAGILAAEASRRSDPDKGAFLAESYRQQRYAAGARADAATAATADAAFPRRADTAGPAQAQVGGRVYEPGARRPNLTAPRYSDQFHEVYDRVTRPAPAVTTEPETR